MRCYLVTDGTHRRYAGTQALAREARDSLVETRDLNKNQVTIAETEIPMAKPELLKFINDIIEELEGVGGPPA